MDLNGHALHERAVRLPTTITPPLWWRPADLMEWVYGGYHTVESAELRRFYATRAVVTPLNSSAAELNEQML